MPPRLFWVLMILLAMCTGCTTVGSGNRTIVRARCEVPAPPVSKDAKIKDVGPCSYLAARYPNLIVSDQTKDKDRIMQIGPEGALALPSQRARVQ